MLLGRRYVNLKGFTLKFNRVRSIVNLRLGLRVAFLFVFLASTFVTPRYETVQAAAAGFSEYYIPGGTDQLFQILKNIDNDPDLGNALGGGGTYAVAPCNQMHNVITVTVNSDNTTLYYDHWENGYGAGSIGADETYTANKGDVLVFNLQIFRYIVQLLMLVQALTQMVIQQAVMTGAIVFMLLEVLSLSLRFWPEVTGTVFSNAWEAIQSNLTRQIIQFQLAKI